MDHDRTEQSAEETELQYSSSSEDNGHISKLNKSGTQEKQPHRIDGMNDKQLEGHKGAWLKNGVTRHEMVL
ncbi:unnamed protein product [Caenorhabditis nigoni]